jgi:hypothetical protein
MNAPYITKGTRIHARWFAAQTDPPASLAGFQMKVSATDVEVLGTCVHFRGDHPTNPTEVRIYIDVEGELPAVVKKIVPIGCKHQGGHVEIRQEWILGVEQDGQTYQVSGK